MGTKATKKMVALMSGIVMCANSLFAQTTQTQQQKQDAEGKSLREWFDSGEIVIEGTVVDWTPYYFTNSSGQTDEDGLCYKVKINRVLKGSLNTGYINIKTAGRANSIHPENYPLEKRIDPENIPAGYIYYAPKTAFLVKIKKSDLQAGKCFTTENNGVYVETDRAETLYNNNPNGRPFDNAVHVYQMLQQYCGVNVDIAEIQKQQDKRQAVVDSIETAEMIKNYKPTPQEIEKNKRINAKADSIRAAHKQLMLSDSTRLKKKISNSSPYNATGCSELFISEYLDGQSNNNAVEIYNPTSAPISLSNYNLLIYHNASHTPTTIALTGTISAYGTHVVAEQGASSYILAHANQTTSNLNFNGDVCTVLSKGNIHIDKIGEIGVANASGSWTLTPSGGTNNSDIRRNYSIGSGDTSWTSCKAEWNVFSEDSIHNLGQHANICSVDPDLNLTFANGTVVGGNFEFDVMASSTGQNTYLDFVDIAFTYNIQAFGLNAVANGNVSVTLGSAFTVPPHTNTYYNPQLTLDNGLDSIGLAFMTDPSQSSWNRVLITSTPMQIIHVAIKITNCNKNTNLQMYGVPSDTFIDDFTAGAGDDPNNFSNLINYTAITYGSLNQTIPPCNTNPQITSLLGGYDGAQAVIAGAYYGTSQTGESLLTINGSGFGNLNGTVYMKNAVNNSNPQYVSLDNSTDIVNWSDNQINLLVPSVLFGNDSANYPGTGYVFVKASGATDSASSSTLGTSGIVQIPYILRDRSFGGTSKQRIAFGYRKATDYAGNADTAVYNFRFDIATVTNNTQPNGENCRPLLKQAIHDWECGIPIRYRIGKDTTITTTVPDGISYITFKNALSSPDFGAETEVSVQSCTNGYIYAAEADISFLSSVNWYYVSPSSVPTGDGTPSLPTSQADFFTTALHEVGHASLLQHVNQTSDLMYFHIPSSGIGPYISTDDVNGGNDNVTWAQTLSLGSCPFNAFRLSGAGACVDPESGIEQINENTLLELSAYPNPAQEILNVTFVKDKASSNTIKLVNTLGQTVFYRNIGKNEGANEPINISSLAKGVYVLVVTDDENTVTKKIIIE